MGVTLIIRVDVGIFKTHIVGKLPVKIRVFTVDRFQKAVIADAATIFL